VARPRRIAHGTPGGVCVPPTARVGGMAALSLADPAWEEAICRLPSTSAAGVCALVDVPPRRRGTPVACWSAAVMQPGRWSPREPEPPVGRSRPAVCCPPPAPLGLCRGPSCGLSLPYVPPWVRGEKHRTCEAAQIRHARGGARGPFLPPWAWPHAAAASRWRLRMPGRRAGVALYRQRRRVYTQQTSQHARERS
jgi:hypothetical protein